MEEEFNSDDYPFEFTPPSDSQRPYSISEINEGIATIIEGTNTLVWVQGEISGYKRHYSGHCYFKLHDADSQVPAVMWRSTAEKMTFTPEDGMEVMAIASIRVYQKGGYYQLDVHKMQPSGVGALSAAFEKLKEKLHKEGLFDESHKRPIPESIATLGVVTAKTGAALRDIIKVVHSRSPQTDILLYSVAVQGEAAPAQIANGIEAMNHHGKADCIIVGRGGGSADDLWAFNSELVARAIYNSKIPVISAVGHEIDFTIADFVADVRAATPSAAAEMAVPDVEEKGRYFETVSYRVRDAFMSVYTNAQRDFRSIVSRPGIRKPFNLISEHTQHFDELHDRRQRALKNIVTQYSQRFKSASARLHAISPLAVLNRGYSVVTNANNTPVSSSEQLAIGENITITFSAGLARATVTNLEHKHARKKSDL